MGTSSVYMHNSISYLAALPVMTIHPTHNSRVTKKYMQLETVMQ